MQDSRLLLSSQVMKKNLVRPAFLVSALVAFIMLLIAYSGHFNNPFEFDDSHTIEENVWIRDLSNIPKFFSDATTTSTLPANQAWRPGLTTLNAIDYSIGGKDLPEPFVFHVHIFIGFVLLGILLFFFLLHLFEKASPGRIFNHWLALFGTAFFWLHTANAETLNYIISRSDTASTFWIILAFVTYFYSEKARRYFVYLIPVIIGFFIKEPALMFAPLIFVYEWLFGKLNRRTITGIGIVFLTAVVLYAVSRKLTPEMWSGGGTDRISYLQTQPFVIVHYFLNFILPVNLAVDTDWLPIKEHFDDRMITGLLFIFAMLLLAWFCSKQQKTKPVTFGILWFFIALIPTSSIFPLAEVLNDHRVFFPYIGLVMAVTAGAGILLEKIMEAISNRRSSSRVPVYLFAAIAFLFLSAHTYGTKQRCKVWSSGYTLWLDNSEKCPKNGRGLMNYGIELLAKGREANAAGDLEKANFYFHQTDSVLSLANAAWPEYSYIYVNIGALREWQSRPKEAEQNYLHAIELRGDNPECYYFYADFLVRNGRIADAVPHISKGLELSPAHQGLLRLQARLDQGIITLSNPVADAQALAAKSPSPENYLNLSLAFYNAGDYKKCIEAAEQALKLRPEYAEAFNNICAASNAIGDYDRAVQAGKEAVRIYPDYQLAKNNLNEALQKKQAATGH